MTKSEITDLENEVLRLYREKMIAEFRSSGERQFPDLFRLVQVDVKASFDFTVFVSKQLEYEYFRQLIPTQIMF